MARGQRFHIVALVRFEHITLQQSVVGVAEHGNAMIGEHMQIVFDVLAELVFAGIFQPWAQFVEGEVEIQLIRRTGIDVAQWQIGRFTGNTGK